MRGFSKSHIIAKLNHIQGNHVKVEELAMVRKCVNASSI